MIREEEEQDVQHITRNPDHLKAKRNPSINMLRTLFLSGISVLTLGAFGLSMVYDFGLGVSVYFFFMVVYFVLQLVLSARNHRRYARLARENGDAEPSASVVLLMVGRLEREDYWIKALLSITRLWPAGLKKVLLVIDGNQEEDVYMLDRAHEILVDLPCPVETVMISQRGKRGAMFYGIQRLRDEFRRELTSTDLVVTDSDTELEPDCLVRLQECLRSDKRNGCATGFLTIYNRADGLLPKMIHARYAYAFAVERAASSFAGCMTCCSGPISIYRLDALDELVLRRFVTQRFLTRPAEPGDDRHLTNLVMAAGLRSRQTSLARAGTEAPETWRRFINQQLRWSRSFYREMYWQLKALEKQSCYLGVITAYETIFPFVIASWILRILYFSDSVSILWRMSAVAVTVLLLRTLVLLLYCRDTRVLYNILYYPVYVVVLLPLKFYALLTVVDSRWVTASRKESLRTRDRFPAHLVFILFWDLVILGGVAYRVYELCF